MGAIFHLLTDKHGFFFFRVIRELCTAEFVKRK